MKLLLPAPLPPIRIFRRCKAKFSNARMAEYKWIRYLEFTAEIPKTISGKICKAALRQ